MKAPEISPRARIQSQRRRRHLASDRRTGSYSRREIRDRQVRWLRQYWLGSAAVTALTTTIVVVVHLVVGPPAGPYIGGALIASAGWWIYSMMLQISGVAVMRSGVVGEEWTAQELRKLQRHGWIIVNHVMLVNADVDHVVLGAGGFFAVETKFRSDWGNGKQDLDAIARSAFRSARDVAVRLRRKELDVQPLVVMWGPNMTANFPQPVEHAGVTFCPGQMAAGFFRDLPRRVDDDQVQHCFKHLDQYVEKRDWGEERDQGPLPRTIGDLANDAYAAAIAVLVSIFTVLAPVSVQPQGVWSVAAATLIGVIALATRRKWSKSKRAQLVTGAVMGICAALGTTILLLLAWNALA